MTASARILFVDHTAALGGAELSLLDIAVAFRERGAVALFEDGPFAAALVSEDVALLTMPASSSLSTVKKGSRLPNPAAMFATAHAAIELARIARRFDLLYANSLKSFVVSALAGLITRKPVIWHLRDILDGSHFSAANIRILAVLANRRAARVVANSHATRDAFVNAGGRAELVRVVHNGIDSARFDRLPPGTRDAMRDTLGIPRDAFVVGAFSRYHEWKGQHVLLADVLVALFLPMPVGPGPVLRHHIRRLELLGQQRTPYHRDQTHRHHPNKQGIDRIQQTIDGI